MSVWVGEIQWMRRNGFAEARNPILKPLDTIECRDAVLRPDDHEPEWPVADVVIGNPPFLGGRLLITHLGEACRYARRPPVLTIEALNDDIPHGEPGRGRAW